MARHQYQNTLAALQTEVVLMAELVIERYEAALTAVETGDLRRADQLIAQDTEINEWYLELEQQCTELIALQQPVAGDLRLITASFKIITDLERIADLATNLASYTRYGETQIHPAIDLQQLGRDAATMVAAAVKAYESGDSAACDDIVARDDDLDADCERINGQIVRELLAETTTHADGQLTAAIEETSRALLTVRDIERVGDHAVNIAARVRYMVETDDSLLY